MMCFVRIALFQRKGVLAFLREGVFIARFSFHFRAQMLFGNFSCEMQRLFLQAWQRSTGALLVVVIVAILDIIKTYSSLELVWFGGLSPGVQLLFIDVIVDRIFRLLDNLWFAFALVVSSWADKKQRRFVRQLFSSVLNGLTFFIVGWMHF